MIFFGDVVLSQCINGSLIFALEYGSPYIKVCLVTGWENGFKSKNSPEGFCFAEKYSRSGMVLEKQYFNYHPKPNGCWDMERKYIIYDNAKKSQEKEHTHQIIYHQKMVT